MTDRKDPIDGKAVIGSREYVAFPEWKIAGVLAKVDTGARTSALHVDRITPLSGGRIRFDVILSRKRHDRRVTVTAPVVRIARVKPSSGQMQQRYVVATVMRIGRVEKRIEISLVCRKHMICRMLLGRTALGRRFLIDPSARLLLGKRVSAYQTKKTTRSTSS